MYYSSRATPSSTRTPRKGVVLVVVLLVLVLLMLAAYQYSDLMTSEYKGADSSTRSAQAMVLADSGIHYVQAILSNPDAITNTLGGNLYENEEAFQGILVQDSDSPGARGRFSIIAPADSGDSTNSQGFRYGVVDETGKLNLNALFKLDSSGKIAHDILIELGMAEELVNAILDWIDPDSEPRFNGAENEYYSSLATPYRCKNGPLDSLEELLLVKGVTPQDLFGNDRNRNGIVDPEEEDDTGGFDRGLSAYLTVYSREQNLDSLGQPRIYINGNNLQDLQTKLTEAVGQELANYIIAYRLYGPASGSDGTVLRFTLVSSSSPSGSSSSSGSGGTSISVRVSSRGGVTAVPGASINTRGGGSRRISSLYELVNSSVSIPSSNPQGSNNQQSQATVYKSPLSDTANMRQLLPLLLDKVTTSRDAEIPGRVNINTAPAAVLSALPGLSDSNITEILSLRRNQASDPIYQTPAYLITEGTTFTPETLRTLEKYITARTQVYRVQVLGYFDGGGPTARVEAVIDTNAGRPRVVYWRNLTELGKGFDMTTGSR